MSQNNVPKHFQEKIKQAQELKLQELDLSNNWSTSHDSKMLTQIPDEVFKLTHLKYLNLNWNRIQEIPDRIDNLTSLTRLNLSNNLISVLPNSIGNLSSLTGLYLSGNELYELPESIGNLSRLIRLHLSFNKLSELPNSLGKLSNLETLNLKYNLISNLPDILDNLPNLKELELSENPWQKPPVEIARGGNIKNIIEYFRQLREEGADNIYEAKLLILGEPGAGKTTLANKIGDSNYQLDTEEKSTEGIEVTKWNFLLENKRKFIVNIWDFGGQEIYHDTSPFKVL